MRYIVAKAYDVLYSRKLTNLYTKLYGDVLKTEESHYAVSGLMFTEVRIYAIESVPFHGIWDVRTTLHHLHSIYGHGSKLEII